MSGLPRFTSEFSREFRGAECDAIILELDSRCLLGNQGKLHALSKGINPFGTDAHAVAEPKRLLWRP